MGGVEFQELWMIEGTSNLPPTPLVWIISSYGQALDTNHDEKGFTWNCRHAVVVVLWWALCFSLWFPSHNFNSKKTIALIAPMLLARVFCNNNVFFIYPSIKINSKFTILFNFEYNFSFQRQVKYKNEHLFHVKKKRKKWIQYKKIF